jgi:hypothetical protein
MCSSKANRMRFAVAHLARFGVALRTRSSRSAGSAGAASIFVDDFVRPALLRALDPGFGGRGTGVERER